ncbi:MAG: metal-binding protein [Leptolyngbya sp. SIO1D8]|nr:metal-binding protein [Leptolyngbya sp. SIO1D8]
MPSGKTHDRITLWCVPWVMLLTKLITQDWGYTLLVGGGFLFAGLMFGPDLDTRSVQGRRWGWLSWIWQPYRHLFKHRSWLSHGFLAGTLVRLTYLSIWILLGVLFVLEISNASGYTNVTWKELRQSILQTLSQHWRIWLAIAIGIETGAMSHSMSDWLVSGWKRHCRSRRKTSSHRRRK